MVGLSSSLTVTAGATVTVTVGATAAGALAAAGGGGLSLLGLGPLASVAVAGAASAAAVTAVVATRDGKVIICHKTSATALADARDQPLGARYSHLGPRRRARRVPGESEPLRQVSGSVTAFGPQTAGRS